MQQFGFGQPAARAEDQRLLTGHGCYLDDLNPAGLAHVAVVRSSHAHAAIGAIDCDEARRMPGVLAVYTAADLDAEGLGPLPCLVPLKSRDGSPLVTPPRYALARERTRHVGDPVAFVVAETASQAQDGAEAVRVDYESAPSVTDTPGALQPQAAQVWSEAPGNICFDWEKGDAAAVGEAFANAAHVTEVALVNNRIAPNPMETRGALAEPEAGSGRLVLHVGCQGVHQLRRQLAKSIFHIEESALHVLCHDVGGGFGMKIFLYPEYIMVLFAARRLGRPVKWVCGRGEAFVSDNHGRDQVTRARLALDENARFLGLQVDTLVNMGAYVSAFAPLVATTAGVPMLAGPYRLPCAHVRVRGVFTHTQPVDAYRGAGRPEATYVIERIVDAAARELGLSPAEIRRRNFIPASAMPYTTCLGYTYDSGDFARNLDDALALADWDGFEGRRVDARRRSRLRGIGLSSYVECSAGGAAEEARIEVAPDGRVTLLIGTQSNGQGHDTAYRQIIVERLGADFEDIEVIQGDSDRIPFGSGTGGSRSVPVGGAAVSGAAIRIQQLALPHAAELLEAAAADVEFAEGAFCVIGTDRRVSLREVAKAAAPADGGASFSEVERWQPPSLTFPNGCHICELELDPETGVVEILRYTVVDDFGRVLNPMLLRGQIQGGIAQGIGQALYEHCVFDPESGQLLSGNFTDYALPRADNVPEISIRFNEVPCTTNVLGMKGAGEAGAIGAPPAVINACVDALGGRQVDMPAIPERLWRLARR